MIKRKVFAIVFSSLFLVNIVFCNFALVFADLQIADQPTEAIIDEDLMKNQESLSLENGSILSNSDSNAVESSAQAMSVSSASESVSGSGFVAPISVNVDPHTGSASFPIQIAVVQGRGGIQPNVTIAYNSSMKNGIAGYGWGLSLGEIAISTKSGTPKYNSTDSYVLNLSGSSSELIYSSSTGRYLLKQEGAFMKIEKGTSYWTVIDKKGTKYYFGQTTASRQDAGTNVFKWMLDKVQDVFGNYMTIRYIKDNNQIYVSQIDYAGNASVSIPTYAQVVFNYETRPDYFKSYMSGFEVVTTKRLDSVEIKADNNLMCKYAFNYLNSSETKKSQLVEVVQYGADGVSALPSINIKYSQGVTNFSNEKVLSVYPDVHLDSKLLRFVDMNSDGKLDIVRTYPGENNPYQIYLNNGTEETTSFAQPFNAINSPSRGTDNPDLTFVDLNADGLQDVLFGPSCPYTVWINNGKNGFDVPKSVSNCPEHSITHNRTLNFVDFNADGFTDMLETYTGNDQSYFLYLNNGAGLFNPAIQMPNSPVRGSDNLDIKFVELTGDGLIDVLWGEGCPYTVWENNGNNGFNKSKTINSCPNHSISHNRTLNFLDMNSDGLTDMLETYTGNNQNYKIYFNNGNYVFSAPFEAVNSPIRGADNDNIKYIDMNADGLIDVFYGEDGIAYQVYLNNGYDGFNDSISISSNLSPHNLNNLNLIVTDLSGDMLPDVLIAAAPYVVYNNRKEEQTSVTDILIDISNSTGVVTKLIYENKWIKGIDALFLLNAIKSSSVSDSLGSSYSTIYDYQDGLWNHKDREFRGFKKVKVTDPEGSYSLTQYLQDDIYKGRVFTQASYDVNGALYSGVENTYDYQEIIPGVNYVYQTRVDNYTYNADATGKRTAQEFYYELSPQYGDLTKAVSLGEVDISTGGDIGTDSRVVETDYANNVSDYILSLPIETRVKDHDGTIVQKSWFYYDNNANPTDIPTLGLLTKKEDFNGQARGHSENPKTQYTYDSTGNLKTTIDSLGNKTSIIYDPALNLFPIETVNAVGHKIINEYYGINGVGLSDIDGYKGVWGQIKSSTDPNDKTGSRIYDTFGRQVKTIMPLDSVEYPTTQTQITNYPNYVTVDVQSRINHGQPETIDSVSYYDGLGRLIQSKTPTATAGKYIVSGQTQYDSRGLPVRKYLPFFSNNPKTTIDMINETRPYSVVEYDLMGRATKSISPDGTYSNIEYDDWSVKSYDPNGHMSEMINDAYGRLIEKREYTGADGRNNYYPAKPYQIYATTKYTYDSEGNLTKTEDTHGNTTTIDYDYLGRKVGMNDPDMGIWSYEYDLNGNLKSQTDAKGQTLIFTYDNLNRLINKKDGFNVNVNYKYDDDSVANSVGRLTKASYGSSVDTTDFLYDEVGREIESIKKINDQSFNVKRNYDALNRLTDLSNPDGAKVYYKYNLAGQVHAIANNAEAFLDIPKEPEIRSVPGAFFHYVFNEKQASTVVADQITSMHEAFLEQQSTLSSNIIGSGFSDASSCLGTCSNSAYSHQKAFDGQLNVWDGWVSENTQIGWISYTFNDPKKVVRYLINPRGQVEGDPKNWTFQGYTGTSWETLDSRTNQSWVYQNSKAFNFYNDKSYSKYRLNITANNGHGEVGFTEMQMFEYQPLTANQVTVAGKINNAFKFNATKCYLNVDSAINMQNHSKGSFAFWVNPASLNGETIFSISDSNGAASLEIYAKNNLEVSLKRDNSAVLRVQLLNAISLNTWSHIVITQDGTSIKGFVNGQQVSLTIVDQSLGLGAWTSSLSGLNNIRVGAVKKNSVGESNFFNGSLDDFRYYDFPLNVDEVNSIYNSGAGTEVVSPTYEFISSVNKDKTVTYANANNLIENLTSIIKLSFKYVMETFTGTSAYAQTLTEGKITAPNVNTILTASETITWDALPGAAKYSLYLGSTLEGYDVFYQQTTGTSINANLSLKGGTVYLTLWAMVNNKWIKSDTKVYQSQAPKQAKIITPIEGKELSSAETISWSVGDNVTKYSLYLGSAPERYDVFYKQTTGTSLNAALLLKGGPVYLTLWALTNGSWVKSDTKVYQSPEPKIAKIISPAQGTELTSTETITWSSGDNVTKYSLYLGSTPEGYDVFYSPTTNTSLDANLSLKGGTVYLTLWALTNGSWIKSDTKVYQSQTPKQARIITPKDDAELTSTENISWSAGDNVTKYSLYLGSTIEGYDLFYKQTIGTSLDVALPLTGNKVYLTLWALTNGSWIKADTKIYQSKAAVKAVLTSPTSLSELNNSSVTFTFDQGVGISNYRLSVGTSQSSISNAPYGDIYSQEFLTNSSAKVDNIPLTGNPIYVRLWSQINGIWQFNDYQFDTKTPVVAKLIVSNVEYNAAGQIREIKYGNGVIETYEYDTLSLRLNRKYSVNDVGVILQDLNYSYDGVGNIVEIIDNVNTDSQTFEYDDLNRLIKAEGASYGVKTYAYDEIGNITQKDGRTFTYGENGAGPHAVTSLTDGTEISYDANGNMIEKYKGDVTTAFEYDSENRLIKVRKDNLLLSEYEYDGDGGRVRKKVYGDVYSQYSTCFLGGTKVLMADGSTKNIEEIEVNDVVLSFNEKTGEREPSKVSKVFKNETTNEYVLLNNELRVTANHKFYSEGKWKTLGSLSIENKLIGTDLLDREIKKIEKITVKNFVEVYNIEVDQNHNYFVLSNLGNESSTIEHGQLPSGYLVHNKLNLGSGETLDTTYVGSLYEINGSKTTSYIYLGDTRIASIDESGETSYYMNNHLGSTNLVVDALGNKKQLIEYAPYGKFSRQEFYNSAVETTDFGFTGQRYDEESELMYFNARYYDPDLGRFITPDTIVQDPSSSQTFNRYSYCGNNPVNNIDPSGHSFWKGIKTIFDKFGDFISPIGRAIITGDWANFGLQMLNIVTMALAPNPWMFASGALSFTSRASSHIGENWSNELSKAAGYASIATGVIGAGIEIAEQYNSFKNAKGEFWQVNQSTPQASKVISEAEVLKQYGQNGAKILVNGIRMDLNSALKMAANHTADLLFYNPTGGAYADFFECTLGTLMPGKGGLSRQLGKLLTQMRVDLVGYSQGTIIATNSMAYAGMNGGAVAGSRFIPFGKAVGMGRIGLSAKMAGMTVVYGVGETKIFDVIRLVSSELNPFGYAQGTVGLFTGVGFSQHSSY